MNNSMQISKETYDGKQIRNLSIPERELVIWAHQSSLQSNFVIVFTHIKYHPPENNRIILTAKEINFRFGNSYLGKDKMKIYIDENLTLMEKIYKILTDKSGFYINNYINLISYIKERCIIIND